MVPLMTSTDGKKSSTLTIVWLAFLAVILKFLVSGISLKIGATIIFSFGVIDGGTVAAILTPTLAAYVGRRYTESKNGRNVSEGSTELFEGEPPRGEDRRIRPDSR